VDDLKAELFSRAYGVSLADSSVTDYTANPGHLRALCFIDVTCLMFVHFYYAFIIVRHCIYIDMFDMFTLLSAAVHVL